MLEACARAVPPPYSTDTVTLPICDRLADLTEPALNGDSPITSHQLI